MSWVKITTVRYTGQIKRDNIKSSTVKSTTTFERIWFSVFSWLWNNWSDIVWQTASCLWTDYWIKIGHLQRRLLHAWFLPARLYASAGLCESNVPVRPSVRLFVRLSHAGIVSQWRKENVMISSSSGSPTILVFWCQISSQNSKGVTPSEGVKPGCGRQNKNFSSFERQYLENGARYVQSYY